MLKATIVVCAVLLSGCAVGTNINTLPAATTPAAVQGWVSLGDGRRFAGELLTVTDDRLVMLIANRLIELPVASIRQFQFSPFAKGSAQPTQEQLERMRGASRFPYGIPDTALTALLARSGQSSIESVQ